MKKPLLLVASLLLIGGVALESCKPTSTKEEVKVNNIDSISVKPKVQQIDSISVKADTAKAEPAH
jgi:hypothetical protein